MKFDFSADIVDSELLKILLTDRTTKKNIIWAMNDYLEFGAEYNEKKEIKICQITGNYSNVIQPRISKSCKSQKSRVRDKAEIFTPPWICNEQNNLIDAAWFGKSDVFNKVVDEQKHIWESTLEKILFEGEKTWESYIEANRLEITCGEAPYLVSRYDTVTGEQIPLENRIGLLDRKFRVVNENTDTQEDWIKWAEKAVQSVYGYEFQGDNLLLARKNIFFTYVENYKKRFDENPPQDLLEKIAEIISWNLWQMDGLTNMIPFIDKNAKDLFFQRDFNFFGVVDQPKENIENVYCKIKDWKEKKELEYRTLIKKR